MKERTFKSCLITGSTGSVGSYLCEHILSKNKGIKINGTYRSKGYLNYLNKKHPGKIKFNKIDLQNFDHVKKLISKTKPQVIFHMASYANVRGSFDDPYHIINNNNNITLNLLEAVRLINKKILVIICSTSEVYGTVKKKDIPISEKQKIQPANPYSLSKTFQDLAAQTYFKNYEMNIIITRMFSYTNARRDDLFQTAFAKQVVAIERGKQKILYHGNLKSIRTFMDAEDAMEAYWLTAVKGKIGEIYNMGGDKIISVGEFLKELKRIAKVKIESEVNPNLLRANDITLQIPNDKKFRKQTNWKPKVTFTRSLFKLLSSCRNRNI
ncbi:GDP-mannose 4,6-dehydratase [Candidatus Pelagibacter sp.]|nr:GDP-mannose 4,6-dehydratase [Candidatus Pelagibacter sp.]|tara:strand:- start:9 stop:983 length:975 start_codon:yes stop_codon:yes gene_type:complete